MSDYQKDSKFQHHVPRFYLKRWSTTAGLKPGRVWVYKKGVPTRHAAIKETGGRDNMYAVLKSDGTLDLETVERYLAIVESRAGKVFPKILCHERLSAEDRTSLGMFLSVMYRRSTYTLDTFAPEKLAPEIPRLHQTMRENAASIEDHETRALYLEAVEQAIGLAGNNVPSITSLAILNSESMAEFLSRMNWAFFYSQSESFITSDTPFVFNRFRGIRDPHFGQILFPISRNVILLMSQWMFASDTYTPISDSLVSQLNARIIWNAHREVYAHQSNARIQILIDKYLGGGLPQERNEPRH